MTNIERSHNEYRNAHHELLILKVRTDNAQKRVHDAERALTDAIKSHHDYARAFSENDVMRD